MKLWLTRWMVFLALGGGLAANLTLSPGAAETPDPGAGVEWPFKAGPEIPVPAEREPVVEPKPKWPAPPPATDYGQALADWLGESRAELNRVREEIETLTQQIVESGLKGPASRPERARLQARLSYSRDRAQRLRMRCEELARKAKREEEKR